MLYIASRQTETRLVNSLNTILQKTVFDKPKFYV